jgi:hypothetical protein
VAAQLAYSAVFLSADSSRSRRDAHQAPRDCLLCTHDRRHGRKCGEPAGCYGVEHIPHMYICDLYAHASTHAYTHTSVALTHTYAIFQVTRALSSTRAGEKFPMGKLILKEFTIGLVTVACCSSPLFFPLLPRTHAHTNAYSMAPSSQRTYC